MDCCRVAERLRDVLVADGLTAYAKTSGAKGMQLYSGIDIDDPAAPSAYAKRLAQQLGPRNTRVGHRGHGEEPAHRPGVHRLVPNNPARTTIAPYSLRGRDQPTASTPITYCPAALTTTSNFGDQADLRVGRLQHHAVDQLIDLSRS
ncbi:hypothetical protein [Amycolatopsis sp. CA-128772]|uniref:non-homologous end-joining DNA ligase LigD n=1 Tax=Amycolatopsis sp. CA-128772 TaxID=2073159 RepID=UPI003519EC0B